MSNKLSDKFLESFAKRASSLFESRKTSVKDEIASLQEQIKDVDCKINAARIGGAGNLGRLAEQKSLLQFQLKEAMASRPQDKAEGDTKPEDVEDDVKTPEASSDKKAPARKADKAVSEDVEVELEEQRQPFIVVDTADGDKVVGMASDEKGAKQIISSSERPPMSIKDKSTLKIVKSRKKQHIGRPIKEDVEITELHMSLLEAHGIEKKVAEKVKKVFDGMSKDEKAAFMKSYLKNPKAAMDYMFKDMKKMAKEEVELDEALDPVNKNAVKKKFADRKDKDIDNDGDVDSSDEYLHKRRKAISKALKKEEVELDEAKSDYTINHKTFSSAVQHAKAQVEKQGYTIDDDEWDRKVAMGPKKPGRGKTNRYTIDLMKNGKETRKKLQMQVYYDEGRYELNMYIS